MKKVFFTFAILAAIVLAGAAVPSRTAVDAMYAMSQVAGGDTISSSTGYDTLGAADSSSLLTNFTPDPDAEYILVRDAFTGTGSDSTSVQLRLDCKDANKSLLYSVAVDSFTASTGEAVLLPFGQTAFGTYFDLKLVGYGDDGGQLIVNRVYLFRRYARTLTKDWQAVR